MLLTLLLDTSKPSELAVSEILSDPTLHAEAKASLPFLERTMLGCRPEDVRNALGPLVMVHGVGEAARSAQFWSPYLKALLDIPAEAVREALDDYSAKPDAEFFPKPGPLRALAQKRAEPVIRAYSIARMASRRDPPKQIDRGSTESRRAFVADLMAAVRPKRMPLAAPPVVPDDRVPLSPEMREMLAEGLRPTHGRPS